MAGVALRRLLPRRRFLWIPTGSPVYRDAPLASAEDACRCSSSPSTGEPRYRIDIRELAPAPPAIPVVP